MGTIEQGSVCGRFLQSRARAKNEFRAEFGLSFGHSGRDGQVLGVCIDRDHFFQGRFAFEDRQRMGLQFWFGAERGRNGKIRDVDAGERHGDIESFSH